MEQELQRLIDSPEFRRYHEARQARPFNLFDVLRNAEYEIRHSNFLAWLLQPGESHGIGSEFLRGFIGYLHEQADHANIARMPAPSDYEACQIRVERELHNVDVAVFVERPANLLIAIENKTEEKLPAHVKQAMHYDRKLREEYGHQYRIQSVLLTISPDGNHSEPGLLHASWFRIHEIVSSILAAGRFGSGAASVFVGQYLDVVDRMLRPRDQQVSFDALVTQHHDLLTKLVTEREKGLQKARRKLDAQQAEYGSTVDRVLDDFRQQPAELRSQVKRYLRGKGFKTRAGGRLKGTKHGGLWLHFSNGSMDEINEMLKAEGPLEWSMSFTHRRVELGLYFPWKHKINDERPVLDRLQKFMVDNPIDGQRAERYPLEGGRWFCVYRHPVMTDEELVATPLSRTKVETFERMERFFSEDYLTIEGYLKCLAFDPWGRR